MKVVYPKNVEKKFHRATLAQRQPRRRVAFTALPLRSSFAVRGAWGDWRRFVVSNNLNSYFFELCRWLVARCFLSRVSTFTISINRKI